MILAGDIGGTHSRFGLFELPELRLVCERSIENKGRGTFTEVAREFLAEAGVGGDQIEAATFGVAGPVRAGGGQVKLTNLSWDLEERALERDLGIRHIALINDLRAHAEGLPLLRPQDLITVVPAATPRAQGNRAIIAAGTGLGEAGIIWVDQEQRHHSVSCEGGHCDFAPQTAREWQLLEHLRQAGKPLSFESVLSGRGLRNIYDFLISDRQMGKSAALADANPDPSEISRAGMAGGNPACTEALEMFIAFYGAEAGNLALKYLATGGVYLGGGIAPRIASKILASKDFLARFRNKGPEKIQKVLADIPIFIINSETNALYGAASYARRM